MGDAARTAACVLAGGAAACLAVWVRVGLDRPAEGFGEAVLRAGVAAGVLATGLWLVGEDRG